MRSDRWLLAVALLLVPTVSHAIQLHWSSGADTLTFTEATRAILVLRADSAEVTLPPEWRLLWVGDSTEVEVVALDSLEACAGDTAQAYAVEGPWTPVDSTAHLVTARFCSGGSSAAEQAVFQLDLPAWGRGKCKVVALDPADSTSVLESNEVTFNGGVSDDYAPVFAMASYSHEGSVLTVQATGVGLAATSSLRLAALDHSWTFPLSIVSQSDTALTALASTVAAVPSCVLEVVNGDCAIAQTDLAAESLNEPLASLFSPATMTDPDGSFYPKDFAFVQTPGKIHIIYIRHNNWDGIHGGHEVPDNVQEREFGHQWTTDWQNWHFNSLPLDTTILRVDGTTWDNDHVWAPTVVQEGLTFYMVYAGVHIDAQQHKTQGICLARSTDLDNWTRNTLPVWTCDSVGTWADKTPTGYPYFGQQQFRDPFLMPDPIHSGKWLMYFTTVLRTQYPNMVVGVARTRDSLGGRWVDLGPIVATDSLHTYDPVVESPHVFNSHGRWWLFFTTNAGHALNLEQVAGYPADTIAADSTRWGARYRLFQYLEAFPRDTGAANTIADWVASEYLKSGGSEFIGAYDGAGIQIAQLRWLGTSPDNFDLVSPWTTSVGEEPGAYDGGSIRLSVVGFLPARGEAEFRVEAPIGTRLRLAVYDVQGRCVKTLVDTEVWRGREGVRWDGRTDGGARVGSGVYFVKLVTPSDTRALRLPLVR